VSAAAVRTTAPRRVGRAAVACAVLWALTATGALLAAAGLLELTSGAPRDALPARPGVAVNLAAHNALVALWPAGLVAVGWAAIPVARTAGDILVAGQLAGHGLLVGSAVGTHPDLWRYLPHLPVEWLALSLPAAAWATARRNEPPLLIPTGLLTTLLVVGAALVETYAVPI
jgi:hypothetical protein